jgi:hypothetical protein
LADLLEDGSSPRRPLGGGRGKCHMGRYGGPGTAS